MKNIYLALIALTNLLFMPSSFASPNSNLECTSSGLDAMIMEVDAFFNQENRNDSFIKVNHISDRYINPKCNLFEQFKIMLAYGFKVNGQKENEIELEIPLLKDRWFLLFRPGLKITIYFNKDNKITEVYSRIANVTLYPKEISSVGCGKQRAPHRLRLTPANIRLARI